MRRNVVHCYDALSRFLTTIFISNLDPIHPHAHFKKVVGDIASVTCSWNMPLRIGLKI